MIKDKHHSHFNRTVYITVPWIKIQRLWLERAGFVIDATVKVRVDGYLALAVEV